MDEVFGPDNFCSLIGIEKTTGQTDILLASVYDFIIWYSKSRANAKFRQVFNKKPAIANPQERYVCVETDGGSIIDLSVAQKSGYAPIPEGRILKLQDLTSQTGSENSRQPRAFGGRTFKPAGNRGWSISENGHQTVLKAGYLHSVGNSLLWKRYRDEYTASPVGNYWNDYKSGFGEEKLYIVQTKEGVISRCILMATDPGDLVLDPTCGSGTTATVAEQWGRRWITIDTSRVALALARARIMGARYPYFLLADSKEGQVKEAEVTRTAASTKPVQNNIRMGFVYERVPHITLKSIANNAEIDVIWDKWEEKIRPIREELGKKSGEWKDAKNKSRTPEEWEIPREPDPKSSLATTHHALLASFWQARIARQKEIDASIAAKAEFEYLYDKPYEDKKKVRVAGPFTVESLSPHRMLGIDENDELVDIGQGSVASGKGGYDKPQDFPTMILENLRAAGVQQAHKDGRIEFTSLVAWPGELVCAEGTYQSDPATDPTNHSSTNQQPSTTNNSSSSTAHSSKRAAIFIGPEFGTVQRQDLVLAAREASDAGFDVLIACAFNFDAMSTEFNKLGRIPVLKARMNADLHMADDLKNTGKGNLFVIFGEPDVELLQEGFGSMRVKVNGVDVFHPNTGEVRSDGPEGIACWFIDTDYNEESFFVRHAYFLGQNDPYTALKTTLKAEIDADAWSTLNSAISRPFPRPLSGRIAVKVINHLGDEVMKVFRV